MRHLPTIRSSWRLACLLVIVGSPTLSGGANAATYYVDPAVGTMSNPGTSAKPWSTLEAVFSANKVFAAGDVILLRSGYHGAPQLKGNNTAPVTIQPDIGATPKLKSLTVRSAANWVIAGLDICPEHAAPGTYLTGNIVDIQGTTSYITVQDCLIRGALNISDWSVTDWQTRLGKGTALFARGPYATLLRNTLVNVSFGITAYTPAEHSTISYNTITNFYNDAIRGLASFCTYEYNTVSNSYVADTNHDDFFQSWSVDASGNVGRGTVYNVTLRGNVFISHTDPNQPLKASPQGIGCFDGMFENWVIENNVISTKTYHGIALYGAVNCRIANNTVVENSITGSSSVRPWVSIFQHKNNADGTPWSVPCSGNLLRNNLSSSAASMPTGAGTIDHNRTTTSYTTYFVNYAAFDFSLLPTSPAIGAGDATNTPARDILGRLRSLPFDVGAYEYPTGYQRWLEANNLPLDETGTGSPNASPANDGIPNLLKFGLGLSAATAGYDGRYVIGETAIGGSNYLTLTYTRPEPAPDGASYAVKSCGDLATWSASMTAEVSNIAQTGSRTITVRDTQPMNGTSGLRFIHLEITTPYQ